jgi:phosphoglycolate phosphatase
MTQCGGTRAAQNKGARHLKLVVFDCDGTLVDSQHMICAAMHNSYLAHNLPCPPRDRLLSIVGLSLDEAFQRLAGDEPHPVQSLAARYKDAFHALRVSGTDMEPLYPGARDAIESLARRGDVLLGIATGKSLRGVRLVLGHHGLVDRFSTLQTADTAPSKPHPEMVLAAMREAGVAPSDTIVVGDTAFDVEMARAADVSAVGVSWGYHPAADLHAAGAHAVIDAFDELMPTLETLWNGAATPAVELRKAM